jgi:DNA-binding NtrC family response regulator
VPDRAAERRMPLGEPECPGPASFAITPVLEDESLLALLYVDSQEPHFCDSHDLERLAKFSRIVAKSVQEDAAPRTLGGSGDSWEAYLERTPVEDMEREKLLLLLNRNEWNIARVARMMGVTRRTVYLRLQRYNIPRERVPKSRAKSQA